RSAERHSSPPSPRPCCLQLAFPLRVSCRPALRALQAIKPRRVGIGAAMNTKPDANEWSPEFRPARIQGSPTRVLIGCRLVSRFGAKLRRVSLLVPLCEEAELIDARRPDFIHHSHDVTVLGARIALHVYGLVEAVRDAVFNLSGDVFLADRRVAK